MLFLHMYNVNKLGDGFRYMVGWQVAHGSAVTVFLQSCESDSQWTVKFFMQVKQRLDFSSQIPLQPPPPCSHFRLNQDLSGIQTLFFYSVNRTFTFSLRSRTLTAKPQCDLHATQRYNSPVNKKQQNTYNQGWAIWNKHQ